MTGELSENATLTINGQAATLEPNLTFAAAITLVPGINDITLDATDDAGNETSLIVSITLDQIPPQIFLTSPSDGDVFTTDTVTFVGSVSEPGVLTINGQAVSLDAGLGFTADISVPQGTTEIQLAMVDVAGNPALASVSITVDSIPPAQPNLSLIQRGNSVSGVVMVAGDPGSVEPGVVVQLINPRTGFIDISVSTSTGTFMADIAALANDPIQIVLIDQLGNESSPVNIQPIGASTLTLNPIDDVEAPLGRITRFIVVAMDDDGQNINIDVLPDMPEGATFDRLTGEFSYRPIAEDQGSFDLTFVARTVDEQVSQTMTITVTAPVANGTTFTSRLVEATSLAEGDLVPIVGATVTFLGSGVVTTSGTDGFFTLENLPAGAEVIDINSATAQSGPNGEVYSSFREWLALEPNVINIIERPISLPQIDQLSLTTIDPNNTTVVENEILGISLTVPPNTAVLDDGTPFTGGMSISLVPEGFAPVAMPPGVEPAMLVTIQPVGVRFATPVPLTFLNTDGLLAGQEADLISLNPDTGQFEPVGLMRASADEERMETVSGGVRQADWHWFRAGELSDIESEFDYQNHCRNTTRCGGSDFDISSGSLQMAVDLPAYRSQEEERTLSLIYDTRRVSKDVSFPLKARIGPFTAIPQVIEGDLLLGGVFIGEAALRSSVLARDNPLGGAFNLRMEFFGERSGFATGVYPATFRLSTIYRGRQWSRQYVDEHGIVRTRTYSTLGSKYTTEFKTTLLVENETQSPFGAGWLLAGAERLSHPRGNRVSVVSPESSMRTFTLASASTTPGDLSASYAGSGDNFATLARESNGDYVLTTKHGEVKTYLGGGRISSPIGSRTDRNGNTTSYTYDNDGLLTTIEDPTGKQTLLSYDANGRLESITDPVGRRTQFEIDAAGNLTKVTFPDSTTREFDYQEHRMVAKRDERQNETIYIYNQNKIRTARLADGTTRTVTAARNGFGRVDLKGISGEVAQAIFAIRTGTPDDDESAVAILPAPPTSENAEPPKYSDGRGSETTYNVDSRGYARVLIEPEGKLTIHDRDNQNNPESTTRPNGSRVDRTFDSKGNVRTITEQFNGARTTFTYDQYSLVTSITNPNNHTTTIQRDPEGNPTAIINELGHTTTLDYNTRGLVERMVTPNGLETLFAYNTEDLLETRTEIPPLGTPGNTRITSHTYNTAGLLETLTTPDGITVTFTYDDRSRVTSVADQLGQSVIFTYDDFGNITETETRNGDGSLALLVSSLFDDRNRLTQTKSPHSLTEDSIVQLILDNESNLESVIDPKGESSSNIYDAADRLTHATHRLNGTTQFTYDKLDRVTRVEAPNGAITTYAYDDIGRRTQEVSQDRGTLTFEYDLADNLISVTDGRGVAMTMTYDELERLVTKTLPDIVGKDESVTYTYDTCTLGIGRLCTRSDDSGDYAFTYDAFGNIVSMSKTELGVTYVQQYQYDDGDNVTQMTLPSGRVVDITRDGVRRVSAIDTALNGSAQNVLNNIEYRADNQITRRVFGNGVADDRQYDLQGRLQAQQLTGSTQIDTRDYTFDKNSNIVSILGNAENNTYTYDALDRVTSDTIDGGDAIDFTYDLNDNRLTEDAEGFDYMVFSNRLETRTETGSGLTFTSLNREMTYNAAGRLFQVLHDGVLTAEYVYNDNGQRTRKAVHDGLGGTTTTVYHYDIFGHLISETDELGTLNKDYIWLENLIPVAQIDNTGTESISYLHTDHLLTARIATDNSQAVIWRWEGEAFGGTEATELSTIAVNLRFPGQYFDDETNLHYNHFRYYDPDIGRYITSDPIGLLSGLNTFNYVFSHPVGLTDPTGEIAPLVAAAALIGGVANATAIALTNSDASAGDLARAFAVGASVGAGVAFALPAVAGTSASYLSTAVVAGTLSGAITSGGTEAALGGSPSQIAKAALIGGSIGALFRKPMSSVTSEETTSGETV